MTGMTNPMPHPSTEPVVQQGVCYGLFAHDIAFAINLERAERVLSGVKGRGPFRPHRRVPRWLQYQPAPLRVTQAAEPITIAGYSTASSVDAVIYDFGAVSIMYSIPLSGPLSGLLALGNELYENALLLSDSRQRVELLMTALGDAVIKPGISEDIEDYVLYQIDGFNRLWSVAELLRQCGQTLAGILRAEPGPLSEQEAGDALASPVSYTPDDMAVIDWNAALLLNVQGDDVRMVLEFANVALLEMRFLDRRLDSSLSEAHVALSRRGLGRAVRGMGTAVRRIAQLQADGAILFEGITNSLKLVGDQYLARIYRTASTRLHLPEWDASILRKLDTLESIYDKLSDQQSARRMELLEWIIIILIAVSIIVSF